jgi:hypothetical protein
LWHTLSVAEDCERLLDPNDRGEYLRPRVGETGSRYEAEAAIRTIPALLPFERGEQETLNSNKDLRNNFAFQHGIGETALGQIALAERWHEWLWVAPESGTSRRATPSPDAEVLNTACVRLAVAIGELLRPTA